MPTGNSVDTFPDPNAQSERDPSVLSNAGALDVVLPVGVDVVPKSETVILDGRASTNKVRPIDIAKNAPIGVSAIVYVAHRYCRRYMPRRWPVFTPLKLPELYLLLGSTATALAYGAVSLVDIFHDRDLFAVDFAARTRVGLISATGKGAAVLKALVDGVQPEGPKSEEYRAILKGIRDEKYHSYTPLQKLTWWNNHGLHDQKTWNAWTLGLLTTAWKLSQTKPESEKITWDSGDLDICATHLANYHFVEWENQMTYGLCGALAASVPLAMFARWTGRRLLYMPLNGVQRLLLGSIFYGTFAMFYSRYENLKGLKDKAQCAMLMTKMLSVTEEEIEAERKEFVSVFGDGWVD